MDKVKTRTAELFKDENGILHITLLDGVLIDYYDAIDNYLVVRNLCKGEKVCKLIDARSDWTINKKARNYFSRPEVAEKTIARAILTNSEVKSLFINFFNGLNQPKIPARLFTDYETAYEWLLSIKLKYTENA